VKLLLAARRGAEADAQVIETLAPSP